MVVANRDLIRTINRFAILHAIRDRGEVSRVDIARRTGLSQATVTGITAELIGEGLLLEMDSGVSVGGRRPIPLSLNPNGAFAIGVHFAVNHICVVLMDLQATTIQSHTKQISTEAFGPEAGMKLLLEAVNECLWKADFSKKRVSGLGIAIPGSIDSRKGFVHYIPNYGWKRIPLAKMVEESLGIPTYIENSANALIIFEQWFGVGRGFVNFLLITSEHGIGMAMVIDGKIYRGRRGIAGEIGHMIIDKNGHRCRCGAVGCLETICGNNGIIRDAKEAIEKGLWQCKNQETPTIEEIIKDAKAGNRALRDIYRRVGHTLAIGINNMHKVFDPERIIIAGKGVLAGSLLLEPLKEKLNPEITFTKGDGAKIFVQEWHPINYSRAAGALVLQEVYKSPANRVVPII